MTDDRVVVQVDRRDAAPEPKRRWYSPRRNASYDLADEQARWDLHAARVLLPSRDGLDATQQDHLLRVAEQSSATYWLPDSLKAQYFDSLTAGWEIPADWLAAILEDTRSPGGSGSRQPAAFRAPAHGGLQIGASQATVGHRAGTR